MVTHFRVVGRTLKSCEANILNDTTPIIAISQNGNGVLNTQFAQ